MRYLFILIICCTACTKASINQKKQRTDFFQTKDDAFKKVQQALDLHQTHEQLTLIENITYIDATQKSYAFVFYRSNFGLSNIVFEQKQDSLGVQNITSIKCEGEQCDCKVKAVILREGDVLLDCSCKSCTMLIKQN